jgi:hypothetical protein
MYNKLTEIEKAAPYLLGFASVSSRLRRSKRIQKKRRVSFIKNRTYACQLFADHHGRDQNKKTNNTHHLEKRDDGNATSENQPRDRFNG